MLVGFGDRADIVGAAENTPDNLIKWIREPQSIEPRTKMPALGVTEKDARDIAAYLFSLRAE
jgi:cytochrome c1